MLFDVTDAWHQMGILPSDSYITVSSFVYSMILTILSMPLLFKGVDWLLQKEGSEKYIFNAGILIILVFLALMKAYGAIIFAILYYLFYSIVITNPKYKYIKDYIEKLF